MSSAALPDEHADVVVIGGGLSGVLVAEQVAARGLSCLVLEAGPVLERRLPACDLRKYQTAIEPLLDVDEQLWGYRSEGLPYDWIRVRAGGGRSLLWGGWALRPDPRSLLDAVDFGRPWPFDLDDLSWHLQKVEKLLAVRDAELDPRFASITTELGLTVVPKRAASGPCGCRAFVSLDWLSKSRLRPNSVVQRVLIDPRSLRATGVEYIDSLSGRRGVARSRAVVLSASPIETARLLQWSLADTQIDALPLIGRGLVDHLVASYLLLIPEPAPTSAPASPFERTAFVPRFVNSGPDTQRDYRAGFTVEIHGPDPLAELEAESVAALGVDPEHVDELSFFVVHAIGESAPHPERFVSLHPTERDRLGRPLPLVNLAWGGEEPRMARDMEETAIAIADTLATPDSRIFPVRETLRPGGIAHESSTCVMGLDPRTSVTNLAGQVHDVEGLYVADGSLMPTGLDRPPTLVVLALALNTAASIVEAARRGDL